MISIVTGTLNRVKYLPYLIENTVNKNSKLELVIVDGGSTDGSIEYIKSLNNPNIKLIKYGKRSNYPHFMNLGIVNAKYDWVCQWNDDVLLINDWEEVFQRLASAVDFYIFNWKYGDSLEDMSNPEWLRGIENHDGWFLYDTKEQGEEGGIVLNFGLYNKRVFENVGMFDMKFNYYYSDADMAERAWRFGFKHENLKNIKVFSYNIEKKAIHFEDDEIKYKNNIEMYRQKIVPKTVPFLKDNKAFFYE